MIVISYLLAMSMHVFTRRLVPALIRTGDGPGGSILEAFRWTETGGMESIGMLPGSFRSVAQSISADGSTVVGYSRYVGGNSEAFRWTASGGMERLGTLGGDSYAMDVSADGSIIVGLTNSEAFIWDSDNGMRGLESVIETDYRLDLGSLSLSSANGISDSGLTIVGQGWNTDGIGHSEGWIFTLGEPEVVPLPSSFRLDVDDNSQDQPLGDGILIIRYMAGFTGTSLIQGAVDPGGSRTDTAEILAYLNAGRDALDIDGDGVINPLSDGILIIRYLATFSGEALVNGAVSPGGSRTSSEAIIAYLDTLK